MERRLGRASGRHRFDLRSHTPVARAARLPTRWARSAACLTSAPSSTTEPPRPAARTNSAQRLAQLWGTLSLEKGLVAALAGGFAGRPVLLLDDVMDSGWTLTLAARLLRQAGASAVYPFTLGIAG